MASNTVHVYDGKPLHGRVINTTQFKFDCGVEISLAEMQWLTGNTLLVGDHVSFRISDILVNYGEEDGIKD